MGTGLSRMILLYQQEGKWGTNFTISLLVLDLNAFTSLAAGK
jgi:hypothetical protein